MQRYRRLSALFSCLFLVLVVGADWPRFRGPNGRGQADDAIPTQWTPNHQLWKVPIPGTGHSSPIVVNNRIFLQSATEKDRLFLCFGADDGKLLWQFSAPGGDSRIHGRNTLASSTPCSDGERVFTTFWNGKMVTLAAFDFQGKSLWTSELGTYENTGKTNRHGAAFSPIAHGGKVFVNFDRTGAAALLAYDARTGKKVWEQTRTAFRTCYSTPFIHEQAGQAQLVVASTAGITGYDPEQGKIRWNFPWKFEEKPLRTVGSPITEAGMVFATSGDGAGDRDTIAIRLGDKPEAQPTLVWQKNRGTPYVPSPLASKGFLYFVHDEGTVACFEARSGEERWRTRLGPAGVSASPVLIAGKIFAPDEKGVVHIFTATEKGFELIARNNLGEPIFASPAVASGRLFIRGRTHLFCIGAKKDDKRE